MPYRSLRKLHLIVSLLVAGPLLVLSLTGALLVYAPEIQRLVSPAGWSVPVPSAAALPPIRVLDRITEQRPDLSVWALSLAKSDGDPHTVWLSGGAGVLNINPSTGEILAHFKPKDTFQGWMTALHRRWLAEGETARWIRNGLSGIALLLIVQIGLGLWLWLKPPSPLRRLAVPVGHGTRLAVLRGHQLSGVVTALLLVVVAFTGLAMYWTEPARALIEWVTLSRVERPEPAPFEGLRPIADLNEALSLAMAEAPEAELHTIRPPDTPGAPLIATLFAPDQTAPTRIWVGDDPARVLFVHDGREITAATWIWHMRYMLHVGDFAGPLVRALWVLVALAPAGFVISGLWLYLGRRRRERRPSGPRVAGRLAR
jgi:uncharacterized iron-regulated membrane protein